MLSNFVIETADSVHGCIVYELMQTDLKKVLDDQKGLSEESVNHVMKQALAGVSFLHAHGIIDADIKPENILLDSQGTVKVCDIGSGVEVGKINSFWIGAVLYLPPELILGVHFDTKADICSLACLIFELSTSECVFEAEIYFAYSDYCEDRFQASHDKESKSSNESDSEWQESNSDEEKDSKGYGFEMHHFQLAAFKMILGRIPHDIYSHGKYCRSYGPFTIPSLLFLQKKKDPFYLYPKKIKGRLLFITSKRYGNYPFRFFWVR